MNRALRRHHDKRIKNKVKRYRAVSWSNGDKKIIGIVAKTRKLCSCNTCGNPRHIKNIIIRDVLCDQNGVETIIKRVVTNGRKDRLTKQERMHTIDFEMESQK